jgi:predicted ribosome quality control (RQC) complex YloA/Tae2 family protein
MRQRGSDLLKLLANISDRISRKLGAQRQELIECADREQLKIRGDLIHANLYSLQKGQKFARLVNFYDPEQAEIDVELDEMLTPVQNAQRYYAQYRKADTAEKKLAGLIEQGEQEYQYIDSVFDALTRVTTEAELDAIRGELEQGGYVRRQTGAKKRKEEKLSPLRYRSSDGFLILTGRNNLQNDRLTLKDSHNLDLWLHTQKIPGSHTIIVTEGKDVPKSTIEQACIIAAYNSKARESSKVPVDFALVKHVKKPSGAKPGMVIYDHYETVIVDPDGELVAGLAENSK